MIVNPPVSLLSRLPIMRVYQKLPCPLCPGPQARRPGLVQELVQQHLVQGFRHGPAARVRCNASILNDLEAERVGFEPTSQFDPHTAFPVGHS